MNIAVASGKGGTGKTTLSTNLSSLLSEELETVLVDLDVEEPNSGLFIKAELVKSEEKFKKIPQWNESRCDLCGICHEVCNFNAIIKLDPIVTVLPELCHSCNACSNLCPARALPMIPKKMGVLNHYSSNNLNFVESKLEIGEEQAVPLIKQTINYVKNSFGENVIKIFDSPPGTSCPVIEAVKDADFIILVTEPTPFGFHDLKLAVETVEQLDKEFGVVINRHGIGNDDVKRFCLREGIPILAKIPNSREIAEIYSNGKLIYPLVPEFKNELDKIAAFIKEISLREQI